MPAIVATGLSELDERTDFPALPANKDLSGADASLELKPLAAVIAPTAQSLFSKREVLSRIEAMGTDLLVIRPGGRNIRTPGDNA